MTAAAPIPERLADAQREKRYRFDHWAAWYEHDVPRLLALNDALCERIYAAHCVLAKRAERRPAPTFRDGEGI